MISGFFRPKNGLSLVLVLAVLFWFGALALRAAGRYVVAPGTGGTYAGPYTDWGIAATQIQWAVDAATNAGDTVWVSNGVYLLTNQIVVTNAIKLQSTNGQDVTIVNGGFVFGATGATSNNRCLYMSNVSAFVAGFTFSNGACTNFGGAGVAMGRGILSNCTVCNSTLFQPTNTGGLLYFGGGGLMTYGSSTVLTCRIINNTVTNPTTVLSGQTTATGGGLYCRDGGYYVFNCIVSNNVIYGGSASSPVGGAHLGNGTIQSSLICNNSNRVGTVGGVYCDIVTMIGCTVAVNWASSAGGCYMWRGTLTNCVISSNIGAGVYMEPNTASAIPTVKNSTIAGNMREGIYINSTTGTNIVSDCFIEDNMSNGVTMYQNNTNQNLINCVVRNNRAGGVRCRLGTVRNCLIACNTNAGPWGGLFMQAGGDRASVTACTITSNQSTGAGAGVRIEVSAASAISFSSCVIYSNGVGGTNDMYDANAPVNYGRLQYSCVGTNPGFTGAVIIVADPLFENFAGGDFRLSGHSPCVNTGSNEPWMTNAYDLDKNQRIRYGIVDMGAYERINKGTYYTVH